MVDLRSALTALLIGCSAVLAASAAPASAAEPSIDFNRDIRPILSDTCFKCHGFDENERKAGLRLDSAEGSRAMPDSGLPAIVPGKSAESELITRITSTDPNEKMPPANSGKTLSAEQIDLLKRWIDQGAEYRGHWAFATPVAPQPPQVKHETLVRNPIDQFIFARVEAAGLTPSTPADKATLIRRVTYDLTGLPPTPAEVDAFLADSSPMAYETIVDRLLSSPRYGEHMARYWLDAARYGDTHGLHLDNERSMWPYREWVIEAFNRNQPFDQFTVEQLAGDLLPNPTLEQKVATGFNRCNVTTGEGGSINEEVLVRYAVDRVETTGTVWLGMTLGCAVCHDHKFDPVTQKEFYQFFAFFNAAADAAMDGNILTPPPLMKLPTPELTTRLTTLDEQIAAAQKQLADDLAKIEYIEPAATPEAPANEPREFVWIDDALPSNAKPQGDTPWQFVSKPDAPVFSGEKSHTRKAPGLSQHFFTEAKPGLTIGEGDKLFAYVYIDLIDPPKTVMLQFNDGAWEHRAFWGEDAIQFGAGDTPGHRAMGPLPDKGAWVRLEVDAAHVGLKPGAVLNGWAFTQYGGTVHWDKAGIVTRTPQNGQSFESQLAWEAYEKTQSKSAVPAPVLAAIKVEVPQRTPEQTKLIRDHFLQFVYPKTREALAGLTKQLEDLNKQKTDVSNAVPSTLVMADMPQPRETFILVRGAYDKKGDKVTPGTPAILPPLPNDAPRNRLGLAQWLVDPAHPLTSRVTVNRFWQQYFGTGLVKTPEDFGVQGQWPTHPELLDWLAVEFIRSGWDVKAFQKLIVMSYTYQQSSKVTPELLQRDPSNELLARGPRFRLDAEAIRDTALAVSGLLVEKIGGKSVRTYQPAGLWEAVGFQSSNTSKFQQDSGDALYRRSLYTFWKRTSPPPSLLTFDAPSRETCSVRRARTNTPLQALVLLNDTQYVEAARQLADRLMTQGGATPEERITFGFRLATSRVPTAEEIRIVRSVFEAQLAEFKATPDAAAKLLAYGDSKRNEALDANEQAAWTMVANLILNLDETVTKE